MLSCYADPQSSCFFKLNLQIKASFGISHFQVKYFDEDNEEVSSNVFCATVYYFNECSANISAK